MDGQDLGSAIQEIERLTRASQKTEILKAPDQPSGVFYIVGPDGKADKTTADPAWHSEKLATPVELARFIKEHSDEGSATFLSETKAVFVYELTDRRDVAVCDLRLSPQFRWLKDSSGKAMDQKSFVRLLRIDFRGCLGDSNLLPLVRQLKFTADGAVEGNIQHGRESMGKQITAAVTGADAIPEDLTLFVPVFENHPFRARVACAVETLPHEQAFRLTPFPLEVPVAMDAAMEDVRRVLSGDKLPTVYRGLP